MGNGTSSTPGRAGVLSTRHWKFRNLRRRHVDDREPRFARRPADPLAVEEHGRGQIVLVRVERVLNVAQHWVLGLVEEKPRRVKDSPSARIRATSRM
jgi:hypothetical protein